MDSFCLCSLLHLSLLCMYSVEGEKKRASIGVVPRTNPPILVICVRVCERGKAMMVGRRVRRALGVSAPDEIIYSGKRIRGVVDRVRCYLRYSWDTPSYSLARMCNFLKAGDEIALRNEVEYFWGRPWPHTEKDLKRWRVCNIPHPAADEPDEERLIIMACIAEQLADAFNELISRGLPRGAPEVGVEYPKGTNFELESPPAWCSLVVNNGIQVNVGLRYSFKADLPELCASNFLKRGIKVDKHIMYFA